MDIQDGRTILFNILFFTITIEFIGTNNALEKKTKYKHITATKSKHIDICFLSPPYHPYLSLLNFFLEKKIQT